MTFKEYQDKTHESVIYPISIDILYLTLGLAGEAGECANKVKKFIRDTGVSSSLELSTYLKIGYYKDDIAVKIKAIAEEIGDVLWYAARLTAALQLDLNSIAKANLFKLEERKKAGTLQGESDER